jgi:hypothetical protein
MALTTTVLLVVPQGTALHVAIDQKVRVTKSGQVVSGKLTDAVYAFDQLVIPAGSQVSGRITGITAVSARRKMVSYANGNFSPFRSYQLEFDSLTLPNGERRKITTSVAPGIAQVVHLVAGGEKQKRPNVAKREAENAKNEASSRVHESWNEIKAPGRLHRLKELASAQLPYHRQYLQPGTRFYAALQEPLDFGKTRRTGEQLSQLGQSPAQDSVFHARLAGAVSSATARRGDSIQAVLTAPVFSGDGHLLLPANSVIAGEVTRSKPARKLHHNGDLRVIFNRISTPDGLIQQPMLGSLEGIQSDRRDSLKLDQEGGAQAIDSKTRYLSTGFALLLAAAASRPDVEHGTTDTAGDPSVRAGSGISGSGLTGTLIALVARSQPVSIAFAAYGAGNSVYNNFISRGRDVTFQENTPLEIGFSEPHAPTKAR